MTLQCTETLRHLYISRYDAGWDEGTETVKAIKDLLSRCRILTTFKLDISGSNSSPIPSNGLLSTLTKWFAQISQLEEIELTLDEDSFKMV
jgi:hypothetical protein